ncbi:MAG: hypothetical protein ACJ8AG_05760 [Ktedonobacteraceae bacterium]
MDKWSDIEEKFKHVTDRLGRPIDDGIFKTVVALNVLGISTRMSCEGHLDHGLPYPWADIEPETQSETKREISEAEAPEYRKRAMLLLQQKLFLYLSEFYDNRTVRYDRIIALHQLGRLYSHGGDFLELLSQDERLNKLHEYQDEMNAFTEFLRATYNKE